MRVVNVFKTGTNMRRATPRPLILPATPSATVLTQNDLVSSVGEVLLAEGGGQTSYLLLREPRRCCYCCRWPLPSIGLGSDVNNRCSAFHLAAVVGVGGCGCCGCFVVVGRWYWIVVAI